MGPLSDEEIIELGEKGWIKPFERAQVKEIEKLDDEGVLRRLKAVSFGVSSYGYDARLGRNFKVFSDTHCAVMDPKNPDPRAFVDISVDGDYLTLPPHGYTLAFTVERFRIPRDVVVICLGKSTYARSGVLVNVTPLEPDWEGHVTLELANLLPIPTRIYVGEGICQFIFLRGSRAPRISYADKGGKYQGQEAAPVVARA